MLYASIVLFLYAALSGFVMAVGIFRGAHLWVPLALGHGDPLQRRSWTRAVGSDRNRRRCD